MCSSDLVIPVGVTGGDGLCPWDLSSSDDSLRPKTFLLDLRMEREQVSMVLEETIKELPELSEQD